MLEQEIVAYVQNNTETRVEMVLREENELIGIRYRTEMKNY